MTPRKLAADTAARERSTWLARLPGIISELERRWSLSLGRPFHSDEISCAWVAPATRASGIGGVLKVGMPHMEAEHEIDGLRFWDSNPTVRLLDAADDLGAMFLERCEPGTTLRALPEDEQDVVIAGLLRRLWRLPPTPHVFRPLSAMASYWSEETRARAKDWLDPGLVREGLRLFDELATPGPTDVLLATDLHAGNVLRAGREPWLVIDPKPFIGDPAYDVTQHLLNCRSRLMSAPDRTVDRLADLAGVNRTRVRLWLFARAATAVDDKAMVDLARRIPP